MPRREFRGTKNNIGTSSHKNVPLYDFNYYPYHLTENFPQTGRVRGIGIITDQNKMVIHHLILKAKSVYNYKSMSSGYTAHMSLNF
jgi:hypothetical protein